MTNTLKIIITALLIIAANVVIHFLPQWTDQIFMCWLVAVLVTVTWERPRYTIPKFMKLEITDSASEREYKCAWNDCVTEMRGVPGWENQQ